jgi:hypothetical protein
MWRVAGLVLLAGCSLYFDTPPSHQSPDAALPIERDAAPASTDGCPAPPTSVSVGYPANGASDVPQPVPIQIALSRPSDVEDIFVTHLSDAAGQPVSLDHYDDSCSTPIPPVLTNPVVWTECYDGLASGSAYSWHIDATCYGAAGATTVEVASIAFTTSYGATTSSSP